MIKQLMYKWFGLVDPPCETCDILRMQLAESNAERKELLHRLLEPKQAEPPPVQSDEHVPINPKFIPWRVKQQMLEEEDRVKARLMREAEITARGMKNQHTEQIDKLEQELGVK